MEANCPEFQYFLVVMLLLLIEFSVCLMITLWPQCLGLNLDASIMVKVLQAGYGVPGKEQVFESTIPALNGFLMVEFDFS